MNASYSTIVYSNVSVTDDASWQIEHQNDKGRGSLYKTACKLIITATIIKLENMFEISRKQEHTSMFSRFIEVYFSYQNFNILLSD